jgi:hypothetical protein
MCVQCVQFWFTDVTKFVHPDYGIPRSHIQPTSTALNDGPKANFSTQLPRNPGTRLHSFHIGELHEFLHLRIDIFLPKHPEVMIVLLRFAGNLRNFLKA